MRIASLGVAFGTYVTVFSLMALPFWGGGEVIAPYRQFEEMGLSDTSGARQIENRKFSDFGNAYIPEITEHFYGARSGWLTLWTNRNELGRPTFQISGLSPAYLPSLAIAFFVDSPWRFITVLSLSTCFLAGIFVILFCLENGLSPLAGLIAGASLAASPLFMYWLSFPMFPAVWCWAAGALWAVTRLARRPDLVGWSCLAFSVYSLLMTAYPQPVIFHAYLLGAYGVHLAYRKQQRSWSEAGRFLAHCASALIVAVVLALPMYLDLAELRAESARVAPDPSFFLAALPKVSSMADVVRIFALGTAPELFGNPADAAYPFAYDGLSVTPLVIFFVAIGLLTSFRKTWGWWLATLVFCMFAFVPFFYVLGVTYLGFNLSRSNPLGSIMLPLTVVVAYGADALVSRSQSRDISRVVWIAAATVVFAIAIGLGYGHGQGLGTRFGMMAAMLIMVVLFVEQRKKTHPVLLVAALGLTMGVISFPLMLRQDPAQIATTSPLVEKVRANLADGARFAVAAPGLAVLPPNLNATLGLASVHSYNSLSSTRYHTLIKALGGSLQTYGRLNAAVSPDYEGAMFWMSNIGLVLSPVTLISRNLEYAGEESGVHLFKVPSRMGEGLQVGLAENSGGDDREGLQLRDPRRMATHAPTKRLDQGDVVEFEVTPGEPSVLLLSRKFHPRWQAQVCGQSGLWVPAKTTVINGVFQGVLLPERARRVRLEFKPYARFAWVAHVFWLLLLAPLGFKAMHRWAVPVGEKVSKI